MMTTTIPTNSNDVIDSRDVIAAISELEETEDRDEDETETLGALHDLRNQASGYAEDWEYGATLIRDSYFREYAMGLAEDIGAIPSEYTWPASCIDWDQASRELQMDYTAVDFDGVTYWVR